MAMTNHEAEQFAATWCTALVGLRFEHPDPEVTVHLTVVPQKNDVKVLFVFENVKDSRAPERFNLEYYFRANHWPGITLARMWIVAVWALFLEHEALELTYLLGRQFVDPHLKGQWNLAHCEALEKRHDMNFMISRLTGGAHVTSVEP